MDALKTVNEFIDRLTSGDLDGALALCADDLEYDNVPMPTLHGKQAARDFLAAMVGEGVETSWEIHRQLADGGLVFNERTDSFQFGETKIALPVTGVWEVRDGLITLWRDYFDLRTFEQQMSGEAPPS